MAERTAATVEQVLSEQLVRADAVIAAARPVLQHLLSSEDCGLFTDAMIARVRGMMLDVVRQLLFAQAAAAETSDRAAYAAERHERLVHALLEDSALLCHAHAVALEADLAERLQDRSGVDAVLSPLVNELAAEGDAATAALAMAVLAAQARFQQHCRRMELPLAELPGELFHGALVRLRELAGDDDRQAAEKAELRLRAGYQEGSSRLGLLARLVMAAEPGSPRALTIDHAGVAIFATALSLASAQDRDRLVLSFAEPRGARLALSLRAAGFDERFAVAQLLCLHPEVSLPGGFATLPAARAAALLAASQPRAELDA